MKRYENIYCESNEENTCMTNKCWKQENIVHISKTSSESKNLLCQSYENLHDKTYH